MRRPWSHVSKEETIEENEKGYRNNDVHDYEDMDSNDGIYGKEDLIDDEEEDEEEDS